LNAHGFHVIRSRAVVVVLVVLVGVLTAGALSGCGRAQEADTEYEEAIEQIDKIQEYLADQELYELTPDDLEWLEDEFVILSERIDRMEDLSSLPLGLGHVAEFGSARYRSTMQMLDVAKLLADSGQIIANVGNESMTALEHTGIRHDPDSDGETWLEVIQRRDSELEDALAIMHEALEKRTEIDESELPGRVQGNLWKIDDMIDRVEGQLELAEQRPMAYQALGGDETRRYLILFQNPAELRPTGGFVGTIAELEVASGQIQSYEFQDVYDISQAYNASDHQVEPPRGIARFVRDDKLQFQDANWWVNFPDSAELLLEMADAAGWDEFDGVAAVQPETIQDMIAITGPITVEVDGEDRDITADNLHEEAERQRRIQREGESSETAHKEVIEIIGEVLIDQLSLGDRDDLIPAVLMLFDRLDQRDMQAFHTDAEVQTFLEKRNWAGLREPEPGTPTLSVALANVTGLKTSLAMQPTLHLEIEEPSGGLVEAELTLSLEHSGAEGGDPFYEGFQRYWVDVALPSGSELIDSEGRSADDPDASNGGAYIVNLDVGETQHISVQFTMPAESELVLRRQPGLVTTQMVIERAGCDETLDIWLDRDHTLLFDGSCPAILQEEDE
jgi:hypothetical protein